MAKLRMVKENVFTEGPITLTVRRAAISTSGEFGEVIIDQGSCQIVLTFKQASSLANQIISRTV